MSPATRAAASRALARTYERETRKPEDSLTCPYAQIDDFQRDGQLPDDTFFTDFLNAGQPQCFQVMATAMAWQLSEDRISRQVQYQQDQWAWGRGFYPRVDENGRVVTPAATIQESFQQILGSSVRQLEVANDVGQMIGALYAGVTAQVIGDRGGLAGLSQAIGGQPSYIDQVARESATGLQGAAANAALQSLSAAQQFESRFFQAISAILSALTQTRSQLQAAEAQCWQNLTTRACKSTPNASNVCTANTGNCTTDPDTGQQTCPPTFQIRIATSTVFSDAVIAAQITPRVTPAQADLQKSQVALQTLNNLIQGVTNTTSLNAQRLAFTQLDSLIANKQLHQRPEVEQKEAERDAISDSVATLLQTTAQTWGGSGTGGNANVAWNGDTSSSVGWCNVNNQATIAAWQQKWRQ
jgi:hypothetical protein